MKHLYIVSLILCQSRNQGTWITKQTMSWRKSDNVDEALGAVIRVTSEAYPDWCIQSYIISEVPAEHIADMYEEQKGHWEIPVVNDVIEPKGDVDEQLSTNSSV